VSIPPLFSRIHPKDIEINCGAGGLTMSRMPFALGRMDIYSVIEDDLRGRPPDSDRPSDRLTGQSRRPRAMVSSGRFVKCRKGDLHMSALSEIFGPAILGGSAMAAFKNVDSPFIRSFPLDQTVLLSVASSCGRPSFFFDAAVVIRPPECSDTPHSSKPIRCLQACA